MINGYKYGVEYPTNGKKPDLPDDVRVCIYYDTGYSCIQILAFVAEWGLTVKFRIVDDRYKGLNQPLENPKQLDNSWHTRGELPPVGAVCEVLRSDWDKWEKCEILFSGKLVTVFKSESRVECAWDNEELSFRPIKSGREKFINAVFGVSCMFTDYHAQLLYDAGFRAPKDMISG